MVSSLKIDAAITSADDDKYEFNIIANSLANSLLSIDENDCFIMGIEGAWGSGKTSLLNLLFASLQKKIAQKDKDKDKDKEEKTFVFQISPWINGDQENLVDSLLSYVASKIEKIENKKHFRKGYFIEY